MPRLIALDVGSHAVKVSSYRVSGRQVALEARHHQPVPQSGTPPTLEQRMAALDALLDDVPSLRPSGSDVLVYAYPSSMATFHRLNMPFTDRGQIEGTLPFTVENEVPFDLDDMVLGWRIAAQGDHTDVVAVLARKDQLTDWLSALSDKGIDPASVHVDADLYGPWGTTDEQWLDHTDPDEQDTVVTSAPHPLVVVVDIGHLHTTITVVQGGIAQLCRSVNVGGYTFTRAIQEALSCSWEEAEHLKHGAMHVDDAAEPTDVGTTSGYAELPPVAQEKVNAAFSTLLAELRFTLIKAEDVLETEISEVRVTGGSARIDALRAAMTENLGVPVRLAVDPTGDGAQGPFSLSSALAAASVPGAPAVVDLRVGDLQFRGGTNLLRASLTYGLAGAVFFTFAATLMFGWQYWSLTVEQQQAEQAVRDTVAAALGEEAGATSIETMSAAKSLMAGLTEDASQLAAVVGDGKGIPPTIDSLYALTRAFPPHPDVTVELSDLTITRSTVSFNAETDTYGSSAKVEERLQADPRWANATKGQETKLSNGRVKFPITIPLGDVAETEEEG